ncbi:MAG TPA: MFS transporter [Casimicrobiaceae bacterium]|nr:MFS transporter [Casimicrobiaceae bacterium]
MKPAPSTETQAPAAVRAVPGAWAPLQTALFRNLWIATIVSNVGTWMQDVGAGWLMTSLSSSPSIVALVEAADSFPLMLLALPAGALADIVDRRRLLIVIQFYLLIVAGTLGILTLLDMMTAWMLLGFVFVLGVGNAVMLPAWSAIVPELVPHDEMPSAVALNSVAINAARAIGPAIAGVLVAAVGVWLVFVLNALSYVGILAVLLRWRREHHKSTLPAERFLGAIRVGMRFVMHTHALQVVLIRGGAFFVFASATWSLFPLIVRRELGRGPEIYGLLLTCIGIGAVIGAMLLPRVRARISRDALVAGSSALYALAALALAYVQNIGLLAVAMLATGVAWISILSALQVTAQMTLPGWVRARGLASFFVVFMAGMTLGSILWGQVATRIGIPAALTIAALGMVAAIGLTWRFKLGQHQVLDFRPTLDWPAPVLAETPEPDSGPVMVTIEYRVQPAKRAQFVAAMQAVREMRRRNGAYFWELFHDSADTARFVECFMDESWIEHLRQHERASVSDREIRERAKQFMVEGESTRSQHWLADRES